MNLFRALVTVGMLLFANQSYSGDECSKIGNTEKRDWCEVMRLVKSLDELERSNEERADRRRKEREEEGRRYCNNAAYGKDAAEENERYNRCMRTYELR